MRMRVLTFLAVFFSVFLLTAVYGVAQESKMRVWTSSQGTTVEAELVEYQNGVAKLRNKAGKTISVKATQLSQTDQDFLNQSSEPAKTVADPGKPPFEVVGVAVAKPLPPQEGHNDTMMRWNDGTTISLLVRSDDLSIIALDDEASKVISFVDEKKNDLMKSSGRQEQWGMSVFRPTEPVSCPVVDSEGKWALVVFHAPNPPSPDCKLVTLQGEIVLRAGSGSTMTEHKDIDILSGKGQFKAGNATITVKKEDDMGMMGDFKMRITLESQDAMDTIKEFSFFNSQGEKIESQYAGSGYMGDTNTLYFWFAEDVKTITIKTDAYEKFETIRVPVSLETGIGF